MRKNEISEREDHWNNHITALMENHNKALSEAHEMINYMQQDMEENDSLKVQEHTILDRHQRQRHFCCFL